jgi:hypothetical protein
MKFLWFLLLLAFIGILPLIIEGTPSHCVALQRLAMHKILDTTDPKLKLDAKTERRVRRAFREGGVAEVIIARNYAMTPGIGCPLMYWQGLFDPDSLRDPVLAMQ